MTAPALRLQALTKRHGAVEALAPLDLAVGEGEFVVLVGPSGCGKTTLLRLVAGLDPPTGGRVFINGQDVTDREPAERNVAMVFQNFALYPHMTVRDNLTFGLRIRGTPRTEIAQQLDRVTAILELDGLLDRRPGELSGGQRQRVALGRAIVRSPRLFLFDEPLSNLDAQLRGHTRLEIAAVHQRLHATTIFVTHDQTEAMTLGDRIAILHRGRLQQYDTPLAVYRSPANLFVARFIGTPPINEVEGTVTEGEFRTPGSHSCRFPCPGAVGDVTVAVRAESVRLLGPDDPTAIFTSTVHRLEPLGNETHVHVDGPGRTPWVVRASPDAAPAPGTVVGVTVDMNAVHVFDQGGRRCPG